MAEFIEAASVDQLLPGTGTVVTVAGKPVALFNVEETIYAVADACLHQGLSLGGSKLDGKVVTCRAHGWKYNVCTGKTLHVPDYGVATYPAKIENGKVFVDIGQGEIAP